MTKAIARRLEQLEAMRKQENTGEAGAELVALWAQFSDDECKILAGIDDDAIAAGRLTPAQQAVYKRWCDLDGERLSQQLWQLTTDEHTAPVMAALSERVRQRMSTGGKVQ